MNHLKKKMRKKWKTCASWQLDELDEVNSNLSYEDIHDAFEELYEDFEKLSLKKYFSF